MKKKPLWKRQKLPKEKKRPSTAEVEAALRLFTPAVKVRRKGDEHV